METLQNKCPVGTIPPLCPVDMKKDALASGKVCCFKKINKDQGIRKGKKCGARNPPPQCPINTTVEHVTVENGTVIDCCKKGPMQQSEKETHPESTKDVSSELSESSEPINASQPKQTNTKRKFLQLVKNGNIEELKAFLTQIAQNTIRIVELSHPKKSISRCSEGSTCEDSGCSITPQKKCAFECTQQEFDSYMNLLVREITYNYQTRDTLAKGTLPEYIVKQAMREQNTHVYTHENDDDFHTWVKHEKPVANYDKYMMYTFPQDESNENDTNQFHINTTGRMLPYTWSKRLRLDYRYSIEDQYGWLQSIKPDKRIKIKKMAENLNIKIPLETWKNIATEIECTIVLLHFNYEESKQSKADCLNNTKSTAESILMFFIYNNCAYPIFLYKDVYFHKTLSNEMKNYLRLK